MRQTLAEALKVPADAIHWETGAHGKPHLQGFPGWHFNLSDSGDWALLALNQGVPIGVDLECHKDHLDTRSLAANHFSQAEQVALREAPSLVQTEMFLRIWSRKEACLKALGSGLSVAPESFEAGADEAELSTQVPVNGQACRMSVWSLDLPVNAQGAVALLHPQDTHLAL
jgi:4'-phosphopantetheinyl transferase